MRVAILGLGLIGGSIARALAARDGWTVTAWSRTLDGPRRALRDGVVAAVAERPEAAVQEADLTVLAAPPLANLALVRLVGPAIAARGVTLTDVSSAKAAIEARAAEVPGLRFVGGHPMSGRETPGYGASEATLFDGRPWVLVPGAQATAADLARVRSLVEACGARPVELDAATHDRAVAGVSHLPLVASAALAAAVTGADDWPVAGALAAQGWRDATRLARGDAVLAAGIMATNAPALAERLHRYREALDAWQRTLDALAAGAAAGAANDAPTAAATEAAIGALTEQLRELADALSSPSGRART